MAANIDQIFQEFILNKIREIEVQNEDKTYVVITVVILLQNMNYAFSDRVYNAKDLIVHLVAVVGNQCMVHANISRVSISCLRFRRQTVSNINVF